MPNECPIQQVIKSLMDSGRVSGRPCVAWSGGLDSSVLLSGLARLGCNPVAVHVNHHLQQAASDFEAHCTRVARSLGVELHVLHLDSSALEGSVESWARQERYRAIYSWMKTHALQNVWTAHHRDDQVETIFLQMLRGSGIRGIGGMSEVSVAGVDRHLNEDIRLVRPFLKLSKPDLLAYAKEHALEFVDDPTNLHTHYRRNWLRQTVLPEIREHFPQVDGSFLALSNFVKDHFQTVDSLTSDLLNLCLESRRLNLAVWCRFGVESRREVLRLWLSQTGIRAGHDKLVELERQLLSGSGGQKRVSGQWRVDVNKRMAVAVAEGPLDKTGSSDANESALGGE